MNSENLELLELDRDVARANDALVRFRAALTETFPRASDTNPLAPFRHVARQTTYSALESYQATGVEAPLRNGLLLWVYALIQARTGCDLETAWQREVASPLAHVLVEVPRQASYREAWREAVLARDPATRRVWLDAAASRGPPLATIGREAAARRTEVARRLGLAHSATPASRFSPAELHEAAWCILHAASDLLAALRRESHGRSHGGSAGPLALWVQDGLALDATEGWPARLSLRWLEDCFREMARGAIVSRTLPSIAGAATFSRALYRFGRALREDQPSALPFSIARDPFHLEGHRFGFAFGMLPATRLFHRRVLGLSDRIAGLQARALARTAFHEAVWVAARWLLTDDARNAPLERWDEVTLAVFGEPIDRLFVGAWPNPDGDEASRLDALLSAPALTKLLIARFDEDWFHNPEAARWIRGRASGPSRAPPGDDPIDPRAAASSLVHSFEEALG